MYGLCSMHTGLDILVEALHAPSKPSPWPTAAHSYSLYPAVPTPRAGPGSPRFRPAPVLAPAALGRSRVLVAHYGIASLCPDDFDSTSTSEELSDAEEWVADFVRRSRDGGLPSVEEQEEEEEVIT